MSIIYPHLLVGTITNGWIIVLDLSKKWNRLFKEEKVVYAEIWIQDSEKNPRLQHVELKGWNILLFHTCKGASTLKQWNRSKEDKDWWVYTACLFGQDTCQAQKDLTMYTINVKSEMLLLNYITFEINLSLILLN